MPHTPDIQTYTVAQEGCTLGCALWRPEGTPCGTVVAVHGLSRQKRDFDDMARYLCARGFVVYALDAPGRGGSSRLARAQDYTVERYARIFAAFLKEQNLPPVHWVGTSMGGLIALEMARLGFAHLFSSVVFVDITHKPNVQACKRISDYMTMDVPVFESIAPYIGFLKQNLPLGSVPDDVWKRFAEYQLVKTEKGYEFHFDPNIVPMAKMQLAVPIDLSQGLDAMACPVALVAGGKSDLCTQDEIDDLLKAKPNAKVHICPDAGHIPALYDDATNEFIYGVMKNSS